MANQKSDIQRQMEERIHQKKQSDESHKRRGGGFRNLLFMRVEMGVSQRELAVFSRELGLLTGLGVSLVRALNILANRSHNRVLQKLITEMRSQVEMGMPVSTAMQKHQSIFGEFFINAVRAGEQSGELAKTLNLLADYLDSQASIRSRLKRALTLPFITVVIALSVVLILFAFVIPTFTQVYNDAGVDLPNLTKMVLSFGNFIIYFWWLVALCMIFLFLLFYRSGKLIGMQNVSDRLKLTLPIVSGITERLIVYRFSHLTSMMMNAGVSVLPTLRLAGPATGNSIIEAKLQKACHHIDQGTTIAEALTREQVFPQMILDTIGVGEEVGAVGPVLEKLADYSQRDVEDVVTNLGTLIEPLITVILGVIVLVIALSMFLPYFNMNQVIQ